MITAIICEYNPFHNGHLYQIDILKNRGHDIVCFMSGNFVQRGEMSIFDKYVRAKAALLNGSDLVLEIPLQFSICSAERFAYNSINILNEMNFIDNIAFGCENDNIDDLYKLAEFLEKKENLNKIKEKQRQNNPYPLAVEFVIKENLGQKFSDMIKLPNNILAVEYIKAILKTKSKIKPITIKRSLIGHNETFKENMASATYIRKLINENKISEISNFVPKNCVTIYKNEIEKGFIPSKEKFDSALLFYLKKLNIEDIKKITDIKNGFENKIYKAIQMSTDINMFYSLISDKYYTKSRLNRINLNILLDFTRKDLNQNKIFVKLLGFTKNNEAVLKNLNKISDKIVISSKLKDNKDKPYCEKLSKAYDIYNILLKNPKASGLEFKNKIIKL